MLRRCCGRTLRSVVSLCRRAKLLAFAVCLSSLLEVPPRKDLSLSVFGILDSERWMTIHLQAGSTQHLNASLFVHSAFLK